MVAPRQDAGLLLECPGLPDAADMWRIARDSTVLDLNSSYTYLLWCRDFAGTSVVARDRHGATVGFATGFRRPEEPETLVVWQIAVDAADRGHGTARAMLEHLLRRTPGPRFLETTITADNTASRRLFEALARDRAVGLHRSELFTSELFVAHHPTEELHRIGPLTDPEHGAGP